MITWIDFVILLVLYSIICYRYEMSKVEGGIVSDNIRVLRVYFRYNGSSAC